MSDTPLVLDDGPEPSAKRRKVRKGTRSCWECRRRKIKCQFHAPDDAVCTPCAQRGSTCRSQEYDDDNAPEPGGSQRSDPPLARRLDRLQQMMERIVDKIVPDDADADAASSASHQQQSLLSRRTSSVEALEASAAGDGPIAALMAMRHRSSTYPRRPSELAPILTPALTSAESSTPVLPMLPAPVSTPQAASSSRPPTGGPTLPAPNHFWVCTSLRSIIPSQPVLEAIVVASTGAASYVSALCYSEAERRQGKGGPPLTIAVVPSVSSHPLLLAKRALQVLLCIQQLPPAFDWDSIGPSHSRLEVMTRLSTTISLVTSNDDLIGYSEGIECLLLQAIYQADGANLRKAWIGIRRALSMAQMMGIDKGPSLSFRSCDPNANVAHRSSAEVLWYKIVSWERYLSLLLGLPVGSAGHEFASDAACADDTPLDRLEKSHAVLTALIIDRNQDHHLHSRDLARQQTNYAATQDIDLKLETAARAMPPGWWDEPWDTTARVLCQIHHFTLALMIHVPYMLRDLASPRYDYSKTTCVHAARALLRRYGSLRAHSCCRRVDFAGLVAGMTLCLSYLGRRRGETWDRALVQEDAELLEVTRRRMQHVASVSNNDNSDRLGKEAASILEQLSLIVDRAAATLEQDRRGSLSSIMAQPLPDTPRRDLLRFHVPYLGLVEIRIISSTTTTTPVVSPEWHGHRRHPSSATTGALERMALSPTPPPPQPIPLEIGLLRLAPYDDQTPFGPGTDAGRREPGFTAGAEEWALQGVDAAYWSLLEGVM